MGYDISADYVDSTTTYEPRSTIIDPDFIGGHSEYLFVLAFAVHQGGWPKREITGKSGCQVTQPGSDLELARNLWVPISFD